MFLQYSLFSVLPRGKNNLSSFILHPHTHAVQGFQVQGEENLCEQQEMNLLILPPLIFSPAPRSLSALHQEKSSTKHSVCAAFPNYPAACSLKERLKKRKAGGRLLRWFFDSADAQIGSRTRGREGRSQSKEMTADLLPPRLVVTSSTAPGVC